MMISSQMKVLHKYSMNKNRFLHRRSQWNFCQKFLNVKAGSDCDLFQSLEVGVIWDPQIYYMTKRNNFHKYISYSNFKSNHNDATSKTKILSTYYKKYISFNTLSGKNFRKFYLKSNRISYSSAIVRVRCDKTLFP